MSDNLIEIYKTISEVHDGIRFNQIYPLKYQEDLLEKCLDSIHPDMEDTYTTTIFKLCLHLYSYSNSDDIKTDALTCTNLIKSFGIRQNKDTHQLFCFNKFFQLLYSKILDDDQKEKCLIEINEFSKSQSNYILILFLLFYFDTASNPKYNILNLSKDKITAPIILSICKVMTLLFSNPNINIPQLSPNHSVLSIETITQRFYNQIIYGEFGLQNPNLSLNEKNEILDCLIQCALSPSPFANQAKKGIIKHLSYIRKEIESSEKENNADKLINIQSHFNYLEKQSEPILFEKLTKSYQKALEEIKSQL